jgi:hypothetical protein
MLTAHHFITDGTAEHALDICGKNGIIIGVFVVRQEM